MAGRYPQIETLRELRYSLSKLRLKLEEAGMLRIEHRDGSNAARPEGPASTLPRVQNPPRASQTDQEGNYHEILHVACVLAERRGLQLIARVHDALMAEAASDEAEDVSAALDRLMRDASAVVLRGYELPTDVQVVLPGQRFFDKRGAEMWETVSQLVTKLEERRA